MYLIAPSSTGETIDVKSANWLAEVVMDCSGETPKIVRDRPVGAIIDEMAAEFAAIGNLLPKKYFRDKYLNQPDITDDIPNPETTTRSPNES